MNDLTSSKRIKYEFKLLKEEAVSTDGFKEGTHEKVAEAIYRLIQVEDGGITIGLEGTWGTGKSTVIAMLKKKFITNETCNCMISFDAWAHEGDPLRKIFLESLIDQIMESGRINDVKAAESLIKLKELLSNRTKVVKTNSKQTATGLGKSLAISAFLVPLGLGIISHVKDLSFGFGNPPHILFWLSVPFICAPIFVLSWRFAKLLLSGQKVLAAENWMFLQSETSQSIQQEIAEETERSSMEFERYFLEILQIFFKSNPPEARLVMVLDNLDRVMPADALKIWSTMQTFLQRKSHLLNMQAWFNKIWIIVPYDPAGLSALWNKQPMDSSTSSEADGLGKSFFDKNFQLRIEVPKPIYSSWLNFANEMANFALIGWEEKEKKIVIRTLELTRGSLNDIPTPREIKNYINQTALLVYQTEGKVAIDSVAYYIIWRQLKNCPVDEIRSRLIEQSLPLPEHIAYLPETCAKDIAGLVFGVSSDRAYQMLLEGPIHRVLLDADSAGLKELEKNFTDDFWNVFTHHIRLCNLALPTVLNYVHAIYEGLWKGHESECRDFIDNIIRNVGSIKNNLRVNWNQKDEVIGFARMIEVCRTRPAFIAELFSSLMRFLDENFSNKERGEITSGLIDAVSRIVYSYQSTGLKCEKRVFTNLDLSNLIPWAKSCVGMQKPLWEYIIPSDEIVTQISTAINPGMTLVEGLLFSLDYSIKSGIKEKWEDVIAASKLYINWRNGQYSTQSDEIFEVLNYLIFNFPSCSSVANEILRSPQFYNLVWQRKSTVLIPASILAAYELGLDLYKLAMQPLLYSNQGLVEVRSFWQKADQNNAIAVLEYLGKFNKWDFCWDLATSKENKLVGKIILSGLDNPTYIGLYEGGKSLLKISSIIELTDNEDDVKALILKFITNNNLESEILAKPDLNISEWDYALYLIVQVTNNPELLAFISTKLGIVDKADWTLSLNEDLYLTSLAIAVSKKQGRINLPTSYLDALIEFVKKYDKDQNINEWQKANWSELILIMSEEYQRSYSDGITRYFIEKNGGVSELFYQLNTNYLDPTLLANDAQFIPSFIEPLIINKDFAKLKWFCDLFEKGNILKEYHLAKHFLTVISDRVIENYPNPTTEEQAILDRFTKLMKLKKRHSDAKPDETAK